MPSRRQVPTRLLRRATSRMDAFSDGVFAIAITLLVLDIAVPAGSEGDLLQAVLDEWPSYLAYVVSFATIGAVWLKHTMVTDLMAHADHAFMRLNLGLLMLVAFVPFPTKLVAEHLQSGTGAERVAVVVYGLVLFGMSVMLAVMWRYALRAGLVDDEIEAEDVRGATRFFTPALGFYVVAVLLALVWPKIAVVIMLIAAFAFWVPASVLPPRVRERRRPTGPCGRRTAGPSTTGRRQPTPPTGSVNARPAPRRASRTCAAHARGGPWAHSASWRPHRG